MALVVNNNIPALQTYNAVNATTSSLQKSIQKLSTGLRISSAADDAAGLAISEKMRAQTRGLDRAISNSQDGISMIQTAEGALNETHSILQRMRELSVQAANDTLTQQDRAYIQLEIDELREEITRIGNTTQFNKKKLLDGSAAALWSSDKLTTKAIINGGLRSVDQFGQKTSVEGNFVIDVNAKAGKAQVQKTDIFTIKHSDVIMDVSTNGQAGVNGVRVNELAAGNYTVQLADSVVNAGNIINVGRARLVEAASTEEMADVLTLDFFNYDDTARTVTVTVDSVNSDGTVNITIADSAAGASETISNWDGTAITNRRVSGTQGASGPDGTLLVFDLSIDAPASLGALKAGMQLTYDVEAATQDTRPTESDVTTTSFTNTTDFDGSSVTYSFIDPDASANIVGPITFDIASTIIGTNGRAKVVHIDNLEWGAESDINAAGYDVEINDSGIGTLIADGWGGANASGPVTITLDLSSSKAWQASDFEGDLIDIGGPDRALDINGPGTVAATATGTITAAGGANVTAAAFAVTNKGTIFNDTSITGFSLEITGLGAGATNIDTSNATVTGWYTKQDGTHNSINSANIAAAGETLTITVGTDVFTVDLTSAANDTTLYDGTEVITVAGLYNDALTSLAPDFSYVHGGTTYNLTLADVAGKMVTFHDYATGSTLQDLQVTFGDDVDQLDAAGLAALIAANYMPTHLYTADAGATANEVTTTFSTTNRTVGLGTDLLDKITAETVGSTGDGRAVEVRVLGITADPNDPTDTDKAHFHVGVTIDGTIYGEFYADWDATSGFSGTSQATFDGVQINLNSDALIADTSVTDKGLRLWGRTATYTVSRTNFVSTVEELQDPATSEALERVRLIAENSTRVGDVVLKIDNASDDTNLILNAYVRNSDGTLGTTLLGTTTITDPNTTASINLGIFGTATVDLNGSAINELARGEEIDYHITVSETHRNNALLVGRYGTTAGDILNPGTVNEFNTGIKLDGIEADQNASILLEVVSVDAVTGAVTFKATANLLDTAGNVSTKATNVTLGEEDVTFDDLGITLTASLGGANGLLKAGDKLAYNVLASNAAIRDAAQANPTTYGQSVANKYIQLDGLQNDDWGGNWVNTSNNGAVTLNGAALKFGIDSSKVNGQEVHFRNFYINENDGTVYAGDIILDLAKDFSSKVADFEVGTVLASFEAAYVGQVAKSDVKLQDLDKFWNSEGRFLLKDAQKLTITQGDGTRATVTLYATDTLQDAATKLNQAIATQLGQKLLLTTDSITDPAANSFVTFVEDKKEGTSEAVPGTFVIRSAIAGANGQVSFSGDEELINALSLNEINAAEENSFTVSVWDAHSGKSVASGVKITGNKLIGVLNENVDVEFDSMANVRVEWNEATKSFALTKDTGSYQTLVHLADNTTVFQIGANEGEDMGINIGDMRASALGLDNVLVTDRDSAARSITIIDNAIDKVSTQRAKLGAYQNRLEYTVSNLTVAGENLTAAESRIRDTDMAKEMMNFTKLQIMLQAGTSMLAQANTLPQNVLSLLR